jgi:hypothetical protein
MSLIVLHSHPSCGLFRFEFYALNLFSRGVALGLTASELRLATKGAVKSASGRPIRAGCQKASGARKVLGVCLLPI